MPAQDPQIARVADVVIEGAGSVSAVKVMSFLRTRPGVKLEEEVLHADANRLFDSNLFKYVSVRREPTAAGVVVHVSLEKATKQVREVVYKNARHVSPETLHELTRLRTGEPLDPAVNLLACKQIQDYLHGKGRVWAKVTLEEGSKTDDRCVVFNVEEGPIVKVKATTFTGNTALSAGHLEKQLSAGRTCLGCLGYYDDEAVRKDARKLEEVYRANGYRNVKVSHELSLTKDRQAQLIYRITEGKPKVDTRLTPLAN